MVLLLLPVPASADDDAMIRDAEKAMTAKLRDPDSAQYRNMAVRRTSSGQLHVCGEVNAKNGYGGYAGFERFIYLSTGSLVTRDIGQAFEQAWQNGCQPAP